MKNIARGVLVASGLVFAYTMIFFSPASTAWGIGFIISTALFIPGLLGEILLPKKLPKNMDKRAIAVVENVRQTGVYVNRLPQVELTLSYETEGGDTVTTKLREVVDYATIGDLEVGMMLPIAYDKNKLQKVAIAVDDDAMAMVTGEPSPEMTANCIATVKDIQRKGNTRDGEGNELINVSFTVEFRTPRQGVVTATISDYSTEEFLALFPVGNPIPIMYNPDNPQKAIINYDAGETVQKQLAEAVDQRRIQQGDLDEEMHNIAKNGVQAEGIMLSINATGEVKGDNTELAIRVKVAPPFGEPYEVAVNKFFDPASLKNLYIGAKVHVFYMPSDPNKIAIGVPVTLAEKLQG